MRVLIGEGGFMNHYATVVQTHKGVVQVALDILPGYPMWFNSRELVALPQSAADTEAKS